MIVYFVTGNKNKLKEVEGILGFKLRHISLDLDEIQAVEVKKVVEHKARQAFENIKKPVLVEDTGLYIEAWNGLPGALTKWFHETIGYKKVCQLLKNNRKARAQDIIGYFDGKEYRHFVGEVKGTIAKAPRGKHGFGWDSIFIPKKHKITYGQMTANEKNKISMRKIAWKKAKKFLKNKTINT